LHIFYDISNKSHVIFIQPVDSTLVQSYFRYSQAPMFKLRFKTFANITVTSGQC